MLFLSQDRLDAAHRKDSESPFEYLKRSASLRAERTRNLIEAWLASYPEAEREELIERFKSKREARFNSAFFELYLHELLRRNNCDVSIHPEVSGNRLKRPDFKVTEPSGRTYILEAVAPTFVADNQEGSETNFNRLIEAIDERIDLPGWYLSVSPEGRLRRTPSIGRTVAKIQSWIDSVIPQLEAADFDPDWGLAADSITIDEGGGWKLHVAIFPDLRQGETLSKERTIGIREYGFERVDSVAAIQSTVKEKIGRYGKLNLPYVIAVNFLHLAVDHLDIEAALLGGEEALMDYERGDSGFSFRTVEVRRKHDGLFSRADHNTGASAVLAFPCLIPSRSAVATPSLWHNPHARYPYNGIFERFPQMLLRGEAVERLPGESAAQVMGLEHDWLAG